jgi:hypothetical protein
MSHLETRLCPKCQRPMTLEIQPDGTRTLQCLECDGIDPLKSAAVQKLLDAVRTPEGR